MKRWMLVVLISFVFTMVSSIAQAQYVGTYYRLPLASNPGISAWFDHNLGTGMLRYDGNTTVRYDGHKGTDFLATLGTFVYAGATGSLYQTYNLCPTVGYKDSPCGNGGFGNHARIQHADGRVTMYAHLKQYTVIGLQNVSCGQYIGQSGSSGNSTGYHLHFELWGGQNYGPSIDFFGGPYSNNGVSYWINQNGGSPTAQCQ